MLYGVQVDSNQGAEPPRTAVGWGGMGAKPRG